MSFEQRTKFYQARIEQVLAHCLPAAEQNPSRLHSAMRYATLGGGKRLRPLIVYATGETLNIPAEQLDGPAAAVELIHAYSLVHDDLPAMDDDDLRRGKPSCHMAYDEATAILAGDALQTQAFAVLSRNQAMTVNADTRLKMISQLAQASGSHGMAGGQAMDLAATGKQITIAELQDLHIHKTGALIRASVLLACLSKTDLEAAIEDNLDHYAKCIGLAFQIQDDILDEEIDTETLGKPSGADREREQPTFPSLLGMTDAKRNAADLIAESLAALEPLGEQADPLRWLANFVIDRKR